MMKYFYTLIIFFHCINLYAQDFTCIGYPGKHDYPEQVLALDDGSFLVLYRARTSDSSLHLAKLSSEAEILWTKTYDFKYTRLLSINKFNDNFLVVGSESEFLSSTTNNTPFLLVISAEGQLIAQHNFPTGGGYFSNGTSIVVDDEQGYFCIGNKLYGININNEIEILFDGSEINLNYIRSFKQTDNNEWLLFCHLPSFDHTFLRLDENFVEISRIELFSAIDYFTIERVYWDSHQRLHVIGMDHYDFNNPPIWKIVTFSESGNRLWKKSIHHEDMTCNFLGSIKEFENGYYLFGISEVANEDPSDKLTVYRLTIDGVLESYFYLEGLENPNSIGSQDFHISPNGEFFLAGFSDCNQDNENELSFIETFALKLPMIPDDIITNNREELLDYTSDFSVYPTVFTNSISIVSNKKMKEIWVYDVLGVFHFAKKAEGRHEINLSNFVDTEKMYLLVIEFEDATRGVKKIVKEQ